MQPVLAKQTEMSDAEILQKLNHEYIQSVEEQNVRWFSEHLAPDFINSNPDGSLVNRETFLRQIARGVGVTNITEHDVLIRVLGDLGIIHARTTFQSLEGKAGAGRYTDVWSRRDGRWVCVAAQVTRC